MWRKKFAACLSGATVGLLVAQADAADLAVNILDVRNSSQSVRVVLYANADTFRHEKDALQIVTLPAQQGITTGVFHNLSPGQYAVIAYHDENGNNKLDMIMGMFPDEGWGLSNNPTVIGPPRFADSAFDVPDDGAAIDIHLTY